MEVPLNSCLLVHNSGGHGGGAYGCALTNCTLTGNDGWYGGGANSCALAHCSVRVNSAERGGGVCYGAATDCDVSRNWAYNLKGTYCLGGGSYSATLDNCTLTGNQAFVAEIAYGGGAYEGTLNNCTLTGNFAYDGGGGAYSAGLNNCTLSDNSAYSHGGGVFGSTLNNCTLTGNSATYSGGGVFGGRLTSCIVYFNTARQWPNYENCIFDYSCTTPLPAGGTGNFADDPQLASATYLSAGSPCRGTGSSAHARGADIDFEPWGSPPSVGCDEYYVGTLTGALTVAASAAFTTFPTDFEVDLTAHINGHPAASSWDFGDGAAVNNRPYASHAWATPGDYRVVLSAYNASNPAGVSATVLVHVVSQPVHYVALSSSNPVPPFTSWSTAATNIQDAVDAVTMEGALILVNDGVYQTGGRAMHGTLTNRVAVKKRMTVRSVNGPTLTTIVGFQVPGTTNGNGAVRCVYLASGASLCGFTLTNGATREVYDDTRQGGGGGVCCESATSVVSNCVVAGNSAYYGGGGVCGGQLINCFLSDNSSDDYGGGAFESTLFNCTLARNSADNNGGGAYSSILNSCTLTAGSAYAGGGASQSTLNNCTLRGNVAQLGGGAVVSRLDNCTLAGNRAGEGGGVWDATLNNCALSGNSAITGGGAASGTLINCTLTGNSAESQGGGTAGATLTIPGSPTPCTLKNCIVYFNTAPTEANYSRSDLSYCCTTPLPTGGLGNISTDPQLASTSHLSAVSPCRGAGNAAYASGIDIDGELWTAPPSIGCDEYHPGAVAGPLNVAIGATYTNVAVGYSLDFTAWIEGRTSASVWEFGDGMVVSNRPSLTHAWVPAGDYHVVLTAYNESHPRGVSETLTVHVVEGKYFVRADSVTSESPYSSWATAAANIQDAVDAAVVGGTILVSNGIYATGGRVIFGALTNRVAADKPVTIQSVNGPSFTVIRGHQVPGTTNGDGAVRCVYLATGAALSGFTLTGGATRSHGDWLREGCGGGLWCSSWNAKVSNCVLRGNSANYHGGGAYSGQLHNCALTENSAFYGGGGACNSTLQNCTLTGNFANYDGGGALSGTLHDCTLSTNSAGYNGGGASESELNNCILTGNLANYYGGGAYAGTLNKCMLSGNSAYAGGGASSYVGDWFGSEVTSSTFSDEAAALNNCVLSGNSAGYGGAAYVALLRNCTLAGNSATNSGGGAYHSTLNNCIAYFNTAPEGPNWSGNYSPLNFCCTTPQHAGTGNITNAPLFMDTNGWSNLRLQSNSPCINAGDNANAPGSTDLDGFPRIIAGTVDIGAYEFLTPGGWPPVVLAHPQDLRVNIGDTARFSVVAESPLAMDYQWLFNSTAIPDATNATLNLQDVQLEDAGVYAVVASNLLGSVTSSNAVLTVNRPPVANASATTSPVISPNGVEATVVLDGSRSSDPDGDPLTYLWSLVAPEPGEGGSTPIATGIVAVVTLPVGAHSLVLEVGDGLAQSSATVGVEVLTTVQAVQRLIASVQDSQLDRWRKVALNVQLCLAKVCLERDRPLAALIQLKVFQRKVQRLVECKDPALAGQWIADAQAIIDAIKAGCPSGSPLARLLELVRACDLPPQLRSLLESRLEAAIAAAEAGDASGATAALEGLLAASASGLGSWNPDLNAVIADEVSAAIQDQQAGERGRLRVVATDRPGHVRMQFRGEAGQRHLVEASTNLVDWEVIGVAVEPGDGSYEFEDHQARMAPSRFYRIKRVP